MEVDKKLYNEIKEYCVLNGLKPKEYINDLLRKAFTEDKYGTKPFMANKVKVTAIALKSNEVSINGRVYTEEALKEAVEKFKENEISPRGEENGEKNSEKTEENAIPATNQDTMARMRHESDVENENLDTNLDKVSKSNTKTVKVRQIKPIK